MKFLNKLYFTLAFLMLFAAKGFAVTIATTTPNVNVLPDLYIQKGETLTYEISGTSTGTIIIQRSENRQAWTPTGLSFTAAGPLTFTTGIIEAGDRAAFYRFYVTTITAGSFVTELRDNDDFVAQFVNHKNVPTYQIYDETLRFNRHRVLVPGNIIELSSTTPLDQNNAVSPFIILTSTGGPITLSATPTISTDTIAAGQIILIQSSTNTITFQDNDTLSGSLIELSTNTRTLGVGDLLELIYRDSKWWELAFSDN